MNLNETPARKRAFWIAAFVALAAILAVTPFAPALFAQVPKPDALPQSSDRDRYYSIMENVFEFIQENHVDEVDAKKLYEGALKGMLEALGDPYSTYLDESMWSDLNDTTTGKFGGVGLHIGKQQKDPKKDPGPAFIEIVSPIEDTPGWRAGLMPGDLIVKVDDKSTADISTDDAVDMLRGTPGSKVVISVSRGERPIFDVTLTRASIEVPTIKKDMLPGGIAYLRIIEFSPLTAGRVKEAIRYFEAKQYKSLVIDVRNNPGGLLQSCVDLSDMLLDSGVIVSTKSRNADENEVDMAKPGVLVPQDMPVVVLINRGSASASEILSGALKDQHRAYLIGEKTYGKGSVQRVFPLGKTGFKLTMSRYYTPSDVNIDKIGIPPDLEVKDRELTEAEIDALTKLVESGEISEYARLHQEAKQADVDSFVTKLLKTYKLEERFIRKMIKDEYSRRTIAPIYDLEFDLTLIEAVKTIQRPDFKTLVAGAKTLKQLQDEAAIAAAAKSKTEEKK